MYISVYAKYQRSCVILQMSWAHRQVRKAYPQFVSKFNRLRPQDVIWTPYTAAAVQTRAPYGLSSLCTCDEAYWLTKGCPPLYRDQTQRGAVCLSQLQLLNLFKKIDNNITLVTITHADRSDQLRGGRSCISDHVV
jgi:hypothetical protein